MRVLFWSLAAGLIMAGALAAPLQAQTPQTVTQPDWRNKPSGDDLAEAYPKLATELHIPGRAQIVCAVDPRGLLRDCELAGEAPKGLGFGAAALLLAPLFRMEPLKVGGQAVAGGQVQIPIAFQLPDATPVAAGPPTSAQALALARQLVTTGRRAEMLVADRELVAAELETLPASVAPPAVSTAAAAAFRDALRRAEPDLREALTRLYAARYTAAQLEAMLRRARQGRGRPDRWDTITDDLGEAYSTNLAMRAGDIFCATHGCSAGRTAPMPMITDR